MQIRTEDPHSTTTAIRLRERQRTINFRPCQKQQEVVARWLCGITAFLKRALVSVKKNVMRSGLLMQGEVTMGNEENCGSMRGGKHQ